MNYGGVVVPIVTPFTPSGSIDEPAVGRIVEFLISHRIAGIFPLGTTGEAASIPTDERRRMVAATVKATRHRAKVYAGISGNCLRESMDAARVYSDLGADFVVAHPPSYYPLNDHEMEAWFLKLADAVPLPLVLYNIPQTTNHNIALDVVDRLRANPNVVAIKDSANDPERLVELLRRAGGRGGWPVLIGTSLHMTLGLKHGAAGIVPSGGQLVPEMYQGMFDAAMRDDWPTVERFQRDSDAVVQHYIKGRSIGQGLAVLKAMLEKRGLCGRTMLPPMLDFTGEV